MTSLKSKNWKSAFYSNQPFSIKKLVNTTKSDKDKVEVAIKELMADYNQEDKGVAVQKDWW